MEEIELCRRGPRVYSCRFDASGGIEITACEPGDEIAQDPAAESRNEKGLRLSPAETQAFLAALLTRLFALSDRLEIEDLRGLLDDAGVRYDSRAWP